ncbi:MAG: LamB/YcsF family protein, partial [SAR324 cluster bacterium]|nr:LamB/YcsF family protein [SAR324 cluster bacterium]
DVFKVPLYGMKNTLHETVYTRRGHGFVAEFYADLGYDDDGDLIITREAASPGVLPQDFVVSLEITPLASVMESDTSARIVDVNRAAVLGELSILIPTMNSTAETR